MFNVLPRLGRRRRDEPAERATAAAVRDLRDAIEPTFGDCGADRVRASYRISDAERAAIDRDRSDPARERVALLAAER